MEKKNKEEQLLKSLDGIQKAPAPDFFYAKLRAKMEANIAAEKPGLFILRPAYLTSLLGIFLLVNIITFIQLQQSTRIKAVTKKENVATIESFAADYQFKSDAVYE